MPNIGIQSIDAKTLKSMVVDYLRANPTVNGIHYCKFMNDEGCNVMEAWEKVLDDLSNDEWADNIAVQALSDMLCVKLNIISSQNTVVTEVSPSDICECAGTINLGVLEQVHYFGLDKIDNDENETIDNENILEGDEYSRQITGSPEETCLSLENPESEGRDKVYIQ